MKRSAFLTVLVLVFVTWILYLGVLFVIVIVAPPIRFGIIDPALAKEILTLIAGILMLAPFIFLWDFFVLDRYYPSKVKKISKAEASQSPQQSA